MPDNAELMSTVCIAGVGGVFLNMANLYEDSKKPKSERVPKDLLYWVFFVFWPLTGAFLAWLYVFGGSPLQPLHALGVGLGAPTTIQSMINKAVGTRQEPPANAEPGSH